MSKEKPLTVEELKAAIGDVLDQRAKEKDEQSISSREEKSDPSGGEKLPEYRCRGKNCSFSTDDVGQLMLHVVEEHSPKPKAEEETPPTPKLRHGNTPAEIMDCPDCWGKFEREFDRRGKKLMDKEPAKEEKPKKRETLL